MRGIVQTPPPTIMAKCNQCSGRHYDSEPVFTTNEKTGEVYIQRYRTPDLCLSCRGIAWEQRRRNAANTRIRLAVIRTMNRDEPLPQHQPEMPLALVNNTCDEYHLATLRSTRGLTISQRSPRQATT